MPEMQHEAIYCDIDHILLTAIKALSSVVAMATKQGIVKELMRRESATYSNIRPGLSTLVVLEIAPSRHHYLAKSILDMQRSDVAGRTRSNYQQ